MTIEYEDFARVEMRVGRVERVEPFPEARKPAWKLFINFGEEIGTKQSSAQITDLYSEEDLVGSGVIAVTNFPPKRIAGFKSEVLVLGVEDAQGRIVLLRPERDVAPGARVY